MSEQISAQLVRLLESAVSALSFNSMKPVTTQELAEILKTTPSVVEKWRFEGLITPLAPGGLWSLPHVIEQMYSNGKTKQQKRIDKKKKRKVG